MSEQSTRLAYLDWMRGLAAAIMLQGHVFDAWVRPQDRGSEWFWLSQFLGGFPAPIFLFLVGVSLALVLDRLRRRGASSRQLAEKVIRRGAWILLLAYAFRLEQFLVWYPDSRWTDIFRVDTLNCIAVCTLIVGLISVLFKTRRTNAIVLGLATALVVVVTPWVYPLRPGLPDHVLGYLNGNGHPWFFSVFPWIAFALAGITFGYLLLESRERMGESQFFRNISVAGILSFAAGSGMSLTPAFEYGFFDYSLTSPHYFFVRLGLVLLILSGAYKWSTCEGRDRWSPLRLLGQASLVVYWLHIEIVYGRFLHHYSRTLTMAEATKQLVWLIPMMLVAAWLWQGRRLQPVFFRIFTPARSSNSVTTAE
ncbi:MAG: DUF1624 domain-containing protein [Acidobacteria bacterium]|nr:DUF1624 domain-containing protein [Acidobacteriota bacterium]